VLSWTVQQSNFRKAASRLGPGRSHQGKLAASQSTDPRLRDSPSLSQKIFRNSFALFSLNNYDNALSYFFLLLFEIEEMGLLENVTGPLAQQVSQRGMGVVVAAGSGAFLVLAVVLNVLSQLLLKNLNEPPIVFHWFPIVGSTVIYGMDPYKFLFDCRAKVSLTYW
jgi:hypothetical protein